MTDTRTVSRAPLRILCQHDTGSCAACCGLYNFKTRDGAAEDARLLRRTTAVASAWPDIDALRAVRVALDAAEAPERLFHGVQVCVFAGYVDSGQRVGCLLHPARHPTGADLRDVGPYPKEICAGHFCASHDWLRAREAAFAQSAPGTFYGQVVTDAGLVKGLSGMLDDALGRAFLESELHAVQPALRALWALLERWPYRDPDPARFGGFQFSATNGVERSLPSSIAGTSRPLARHQRTVLDALGTMPLTDGDVDAALALLTVSLDDVARAIDAAKGTQ